MAYSRHLGDGAGRIEAGAPALARGLSPARPGLTHRPAGCTVRDESTRKAQSPCCTEQLGTFWDISEATVPPGGHAVGPKDSILCLRAWASLSGALRKVCCRHHFTSEAQTKRFSHPEPHSQPEAEAELTWVCPAPRSSLPVAAEGSHRGWAGRPPQHLPPSKRTGTSPNRIILDLLCGKDS